jgi:hypothetical protein
MPVSVPDILSSDDKFIYMGVQQFDLAGKRTEVETHQGERNKVFALQKGEGVHLFSPSGFLDDARFHRNYWLYGKVYFGGNQGEWRAGRVAPSGNILAFNDTSVLGYYGSLIAGTMTNSIFSIGKDPQPKSGRPVESATTDGRRRDRDRRNEKEEESKKGGTIELKHDWTAKSPIYINSVMIAGQVLFAAGSTENDIESFLYLYSAGSGKEIAKYKLPAMPVFDGMASAKGKVYLALKDGSIISFAGGQ